VPGSSLQFYYY